MTKKDLDLIAACLGAELASTAGHDKTVWSIFDRLCTELE